jgi:hypothetical protein
VLSATIAGTVALLGLEGYAIEKLSHDESHKHDSAVIAQYFRENPSKSWGLLGVRESNPILFVTTNLIEYCSKYRRCWNDGLHHV